MADDILITVYNKKTHDPRIIAFQHEIVNRFLPNNMEFLQLDMGSIMNDMQEPPWAKDRKLYEGERFNSSFHGKCLDKCLYTLPYNHFIILDSDAVPLSSRFFEFMLSNRQWLVGMAHAANHLGDHKKFIPYVSPAAISISKQTYCLLQESFAPDKADGGWFDTGAYVTVAAQKLGIPNVLLYPTDCLVPRWRVGMINYGFVTNYAGILCHMWASRALGSKIFEYYCDYVQLCTGQVQDSAPNESFALSQTININEISTKAIMNKEC